MFERAITLIRRLVDTALILLVAAVVGVAALNALAPAFGHEAIVVRGASMEPAIPLGSLVLVSRDTVSEVRPGDVISLRLPGGGILTHRVTRLPVLEGHQYVETRGDANQAPDPVVQPIAEVIGRVDLFLPLAGYFLALLTIPSGMLTILGLGGCLVLTSWLLEELLVDLKDAEELDGDIEPTTHPAFHPSPDAPAGSIRQPGRQLPIDADAPSGAAYAGGGR
jgi:signal peptidase